MKICEVTMLNQLAFIPDVDCYCLIQQALAGAIFHCIFQFHSGCFRHFVNFTIGSPDVNEIMVSVYFQLYR